MLCQLLNRRETKYQRPTAGEAEDQRRAAEEAPVSLVAMAEAETPKGFWKWVDTALERMG